MQLLFTWGCRHHIRGADTISNVPRALIKCRCCSRGAALSGTPASCGELHATCGAWQPMLAHDTQGGRRWVGEWVEIGWTGCGKGVRYSSLCMRTTHRGGTFGWERGWRPGGGCIWGHVAVLVFYVIVASDCSIM
jgi:hypothetical protein